MRNILAAPTVSQFAVIPAWVNRRRANLEPRVLRLLGQPLTEEPENSGLEIVVVQIKVNAGIEESTQDKHHDKKSLHKGQSVSLLNWPLNSPYLRYIFQFFNKHFPV